MPVHTRPNTALRPDATVTGVTDAAARRTGWRLNRARILREAAETAQDADAARRNRRIVGGSYPVDVPADLQVIDRDTGEPVEREIVSLAAAGNRPAYVSDPAHRWTARQLLAAARSAALRERRTIRPRPSREAAEDTAADLIVKLIGREAGPDADRELGRTAGAMPLRRDLTDAYLRRYARMLMLRRAEDDARGIDPMAGTDALPAAADAAATVTADALAPADQKWADGLTDPTADPLPPHLASAGLPARTVWAAWADTTGVGAAAVCAVTGQEWSAARKMIQRGRADLRAGKVDTDTAAALRRDAGTDAALRDALRPPDGTPHRVLPTDLDRARRERERVLRDAVTAAAARGDRETVRRLAPILRRRRTDAPILTDAGPTVTRARPIAPMPDRYPARDPENVRTDRREVAHAPVEWTRRVPSDGTPEAGGTVVTVVTDAHRRAPDTADPDATD